MQLELFRTPSQAPGRPPVWENLNQKERERIIAILARLMSKAIHPHPGRDSDER